MKIYAILQLAFVMYFGFDGYSQMYKNKLKFEDLRKSKVFKLSPFHFFDRSLNVQGEFFTSSTFKNSLLIGLTGMYRDDKNVADKGIALELQGRYYPRSFSADTIPFIRNKAAGFYLAYGAQLGINEKSTYNGYYYNNGSYNSEFRTKSAWVTPFFCFGYQVVAWETLYVDFYLGGAIKINDVSYSPEFAPSLNYAVDSEPSIFDRAYKGILPKIGFAVGIGI